MADNTVQGTVPVATDEVTYSGDANQHVQLVRMVQVTGAEGAKTVVDLPGDATDGQLVNLGANNDVTVTSGTVTANLAAGTNNIGDVDVLSIAAGDNNIGNVDVVTVPTDPFGANADAASPSGSISAKLRQIATTGIPVSAALPAGSNNIGDVDVLSIAAGDNNIGNVDVVTVPTDPFGANADAASPSGSISAKLRQIATTGIPVSAALPAGSNNIGDVDILSIAAGDNNIGNVDIVTMPNVTLAAGTNTNEVVGDAAHDAAAAGNPLLLAGIAQDTDDTAPPNRVSAEGDVTRLATDRSGAMYVRPHGPQVWSYHLDTSTAQTDATVHAAPGAGLSLYVGTLVISSGAASALNVFFEEGATRVLGPYYLEAINGRGVAITFNPPKKITPNTALTVTTSASIPHCVDVTGFTSQG